MLRPVHSRSQRLRGLGLLGLLGLGLLAADGGTSWAKPATGTRPDDVRCDAKGCSLSACMTQAALENPLLILDGARVVPWYVDGRSQGFKLFAVRAGSVPAQAGVQNGDVLVGLNGRPVLDPASAQAAWDAAGQSPELHLSFLHSGQPVERTLRLDRKRRPQQQCPPMPALSDRKTDAAPSPARSQSPATSTASMDSALQNIRCQGSRCTLPRSTLDRVLADQTLILGSARVVPKVQEGVVRGFALYGLRRASLFDRLGFQNGDVVHTVAGQTLDSPEAALNVYTSVRSAGQIVVDFERAGSKQTRTVVIEDSAH